MTEARLTADRASLERLSRAFGLAPAEILKAVAQLAKAKKPAGDRMNVGEV